MSRSPRQLYVISFLPNAEMLRQVRLRHHRKQLLYFLEHDFSVTVLSQNYAPHEKFNDDDVNYVDGPAEQTLPPGAARNLLLNDFYKSDLDFAVFADDDAIIDDKHCDGIKAICAPLDRPENFSGVDLLAPINPVRRGFNADYRAEPEKFEKYWSLTAIDDLKGSLFVLRNFRKSGRSEYWFSPEYDDDGAGGFIGGEDGDFCMQIIRDGGGAFTIENCVLKELGSVNDSTWAQETSERSAQKSKRMELLHTRFGKYGFDAYGSRKWSNFWKANSDKSRLQTISKSQPAA